MKTNMEVVIIDRGHRGGNQRGGRGRGRPTQQQQQQQQHNQQEGQHEHQNNNISAWNIELNKNEVFINNSNSEVIKWLLDSGCTAHLIINDNWFSSCVELKIPIDVCLSDYSNSTATKVGKLNVIFEVSGKMNENRERATEILQIVHTDLRGPHSVAGYRGVKYFLTFVDDYSKCARINTLKTKDETLKCFIDYVNYVETQFNKKIKKLQCDKGTEYLNQGIYDFIRGKGIELVPYPTGIHELNGVVERYNRSVMDIGRCLCKEARKSKCYWPEMIETAAYLKNRTLANMVEALKSPYEIFFGKRPNNQNLKIYGSRVFARIQESKRKDWDDKASIGVLVGYTHFGYKVLIQGMVVEVRHVKVVENDTKLICLRKNNEINENDFVRFDMNSENESDVQNNSSDDDRVFGENENQNIEFDAPLNQNRDKSQNKNKK